MKNEKRRLNIALTLLFAIVIFFTVVVAVLLSGIVLYLLIHFEVIAAQEDYLANARNVIWYMGFSYSFQVSKSIWQLICNLLQMYYLLNF